MNVFRKDYKFWASVYTISQPEDVHMIGEVLGVAQLIDIVLALNKNLTKPYLTLDNMNYRITINGWSDRKKSLVEYVFKTNMKNEWDRAIYEEFVKWQTGDVIHPKSKRWYKRCPWV